MHTQQHTISQVVLLLTLTGLTMAAQDTSLNQSLHPAFSERVEEREALVKTGIENYPYQPVKDPMILKAMRRVPRHMFVPEEYRSEAYLNAPLPIGHSQTISQPVIVAHMTELLDIQRDHRVLEIGTGSGYQAAVLAELCDHVYTIEIIQPLGEQAAALLALLGYSKIHAKIGDGYEGWPRTFPFR